MRPWLCIDYTYHLHDFCMALDFLLSTCVSTSCTPSLCVKMLLCSFENHDRYVTNGDEDGIRRSLSRLALQAWKTGRSMHSVSNISIGKPHHRGVPEAVSTPWGGGQFDVQAADRFDCTKTAWKTNVQKSPTELESHFKPKHERFRFYKRNQQQGGDCVRVRGGTTKTGAEPNLDLKRTCELAQGIEAGAAVSLMSETTYGLSSYTGPKLEPYTLKL